ncbi:MAG: aldose epimerase family protein [Verrucomicrobiota bacterium]
MKKSASTLSKRPVAGVNKVKAVTGIPVTVKPYGKTADGQKVELYTLTNKNGIKVTLMTYGATVVDILTPDRDGKLADVALGFGSFKPYLTKSPYFGCIAGRFANRIANGKFTLEGKTYKLAKNDGPHHLHGGLKAFDKLVWKAEILKSNQPSVRLTLHSPDGHEGYPGNLDVAVTYTLTDKNELRIAYQAATDKTTVINLTNHTYFNLAGAGSGSVLDHQIKLHTGDYTAVNQKLLPTGEIKSVDGSVLDFRTLTPIGLHIMEVGNIPVGYDHNYVLSRKPQERVAIAAEVYEPKSGRRMKVYTDQPGIQFYSGNFLDGTVKGKGGKAYKQHHGFCLETQHFPDSPNQPKFPSTKLKPGQVYKTTTVYQFSAK